MCLLLGILAAGLLVLPIAPAAHGDGLGSVEPLTPWRKPLVVLPRPRTLDYLGLAQQGVGKAASWRHDGWFCEYLGCDNSVYPLLTIWGEVPMFETADALQLADPSSSHRRLVEKFGLASEHYWDRGLGGYAPYPGDRERSVQAFFDDNGWLGLAFARHTKPTRNIAGCATPSARSTSSPPRAGMRRVAAECGGTLPTPTTPGPRWPPTRC